MFSKRIFFYFLGAALIVAFLVGIRYVYQKKFVKIHKEPTTKDISNSETKNDFLHNSQVIFVDYENYDKKEELYDKKSFSGKYSCKVFGKNSFSAVVTKSVADIGKENLTRVGFSAYVYIFSENFDKLKADLVFSVVDSKGNSVVWKNLAMNSVYMEAQKWIKISGAYDINVDTIPNDGVIKAYLWNDSKTKILIDDFMVVTGKDQSYRGDTTFCDNTHENGWVKSFNYPPFPFQYLISEEINNDHSEYLIKSKTVASGQLFPDTKICTGNFYNTNNQKDKIIAVEGKKLNAYSFCEQNKAFSNDLSLTLNKNDSLWHTANLYPAKFSSKPNDEILLADAVTKKIILVSINNEMTNSCQAQPAEMKLKVLWDGAYNNFEKNGNLPVYFATPYLLNLQRASLLSVYSDGSWQVFEFQKTNWIAVAQSKKPIKEWAEANYKYNFVCGKFLTQSTGDLLLSVSTSKKNSQSVYSLWAFNKESKNFIEVNGSKKSKVRGLDTLKSTDNLFAVKGFLTEPSATFSTEGTRSVSTLMRYNNDWRFDLKHIAFNDTTYHILSTIDFKGYKNDYNPKFYEIVRLIPGCFIEKNKTSIITVCYNYKNKSSNNSKSKQYVNYNFLPNALHIFTYKK